jgi:hypothetical protein
MERGSAIRRLLRRVRNAWENGSVWVAFVIGLAMGPQLQGIVFVLAIIMASGTAFGIQISAAIVFVFAWTKTAEEILESLPQIYLTNFRCRTLVSRDAGRFT